MEFYSLRLASIPDFLLLLAFWTFSGCAAWSNHSLDGFFEREVTSSSKAWMGDSTDETSRGIFRLAARKGLGLDALVVTQHGFHLTVYSLFFEDHVEIYFVHGSNFSQKGASSIELGALSSLIQPMEEAGKCELLEKTQELSGDIVLYRHTTGIRACQEQAAFYSIDGYVGYLRDAFWKAFPYEDVDWFYEIATTE